LLSVCRKTYHLKNVGIWRLKAVNVATILNTFVWNFNSGPVKYQFMLNAFVSDKGYWYGGDTNSPCVLSDMLVSQRLTILDPRLTLNRIPPTTKPLPNRRKKQIQSLLSTTSISAREIQRDTLYEIILNLPTGTNLYLQISLPPTFPETSPVLHVRPQNVYQHPWIHAASSQVTGHEKLGAGWTQHTSLGKLVSEVVRELTERPPTKIGSGDGTTFGSPNSGGGYIIAGGGGSSSGSASGASSSLYGPSPSMPMNIRQTPGQNHQQFTPPPYPANPLLQQQRSPNHNQGYVTPPPLPPPPVPNPYAGGDFYGLENKS
jgi:uncharacterized membrane protein YgcG